MKKVLGIAALIGALAVAGVVLGQAINLPQVTQINSGDLFQDVTNGIPTATSFYATANQIGSLGNTLPGGNPENSLIGGDFGGNLFAYGASVASINTTSAYVANRWFAWGGNSSSLTGAQETGTTDIPQGYTGSLRLSRTGAGISQACAGQVVESVNAARYQGATAEYDFHALAGSGFSAASSNLKAYIVAGTGTDEGSQKMAYTVNTLGGGAAGWTNGTLEAAAVTTISTAWNRYTVVANIPATISGSNVNEVGVAICFTPVGTSPSNDYFEFTGAQLVPNQALTGVATLNTTSSLNINDVRAKAFNRRPQQMETALQERYYWVLNEVPTGTGPSISAMATGQVITTTSARYAIWNPVPMRVTPTPIATFGTLATTNTAGTGVALTALAAVTSGSSASVIELLGTVSSGLVQGAPTVLQSGNSSGGGQIGANAEE